MTVRDIGNVAEFDGLLAKKRHVVVDVWAEWCAPCRFFSPIFEKVAEQRRGVDTAFVRVNADDVPELSERYRVSSIPTVLVFTDGELANRQIGAVSPAEFGNFLNISKV